jgi:hypothetical protein
MSQTRVKFATQVNSETLLAVRMLAEKEGRQLQALVEEVLADLIEKHKNAKPRPHVVGAYLTSLDKYGPLYKKLAGATTLPWPRCWQFTPTRSNAMATLRGVRDQGLLEAALYRPQTVITST